MAVPISRSIKNLKGGISQQPHLLRFDEQGSTQVNGWSSEASGLQKRPASVYKSRVGAAGSLGAKPLVHSINRDLSERYDVMFTGTGIRVFKLGDTIQEMKVNTPQGVDYITSANPRTELRATTVADYTFVANRSKVVQKSGGKTDAGSVGADDRDRVALVLCRGGQYGRTLAITVNGHRQEVVMPVGVDADPKVAADMVKQTDAQWILGQFSQKLTNDAGLKGFSFGVGPGYLHIIAPVGQTISQLEVVDGYAGQLLSIVRHEVSTVAKLPIEAPDNYTVLIRGDTTKTGDAYYIRYDAGQKVWKEHVGWGVDPAMNNATMPWALRREANGEFTFQALDGTNGFPKWAEKRAGDDDTNPFPSFVGQTINDLFLFRNRLGVLSGENIILSRTGHYFDFFPASVANLSDDDAIDVAISHNKVSILKYAVPFSEQLLLWSDQAQFVFGAQGTLTPKSVELDLSTEFEVSDYCRPLGLGRSVYYITPRTSFSSMNRYYVVGDTSGIKDSEDICSHIPYYIPNGAYALTGSTTDDFVALLTENAKNKIFIFKYKFQNEVRTQLSWSHWEFSEDVKIHCATVIESRIYVFGENGTDAFALTLDLTSNTKDILQEPYRTYLDFKAAFTPAVGSYDINSNTTKLTPHDIYNITFSKDKDFLTVSSTGVVNRFPCPSSSWDANAHIEIEGNQEGKLMIVGFAFEFEYTFSQFMVRQAGADGSVQAVDTGRLQLRKGWVNYQDTGAFEIYVVNRNRWADDGITPLPFKYTFSGIKPNSPDAILGRELFTSGQFTFPIPGNSNEVETTLVSSSVNPLSIIGFGWTGIHVQRSTSI